MCQREKNVKYWLDNWYLFKEPYDAGRSMCTKKLFILYYLVLKYVYV